MEGAIELRPGRPGDGEIFQRLERLSPGASHWSGEDYEHFLSGQGVIALLAAEAGRKEAAGFVLARLMADEVEILNLAVAPAYRRRGIAYRLMEEALERARGLGARQCWLEVRAANQGARAFYRTVGFEEQARRRGYYRDPSDDALVCQRRLEAGAEPVLPSRRAAEKKDSAR